MAAPAQGDIPFRTAANWKRLAIGASGKVLTSNGTGADPSWETPTGGAPTGAAGGDLSGTYPNPSVVDDSHLHTEATLSLSDVTTDNVSITQHGFAPKAPNDATKYLDGTGGYSVPTGSGSPGTDTNGFLIIPFLDRLGADVQGLGTNNRVYLWSVHISQQITLPTASFRVNASAGTTVVGVGFYSASGGTLIASQSATLSSGAGVKTITFSSPPTLSPGTYLFAFTTPDVSLSGFYGILINADFELIMQSQHIRIGYATNTSTAGALPSTTGTILALTSAFFQVFVKLETT